jgi:hypothetical protein
MMLMISNSSKKLKQSGSCIVKLQPNAKVYSEGDRTSSVNIDSVLDGICNCTATSEVLSPIKVQDMDDTFKIITLKA